MSGKLAKDDPGLIAAFDTTVAAVRRLTEEERLALLRTLRSPTWRPRLVDHLASMRTSS